MTRGSIREYTQVVRARYLVAGKVEKSRILDEFERVVGCHRKSAIRLLRRGHRYGVSKKRGRPRQYGSVTANALKAVWEASDCLCSKRLHPFLPELVSVLRNHGESDVGAQTVMQLCQISPSTIDRLLRPWRSTGKHRSFSTTRPGNLLKNSIPIRTFADWQDSSPGFLEVDLVAHCGESSEGFYLTTLSTVDVVSGWSECLGVWGKGQDRVGAAVHQVRQRLPFALLGVDSDNGSEFINQHLYRYCRREGITFTRSRSYKKNDSCHVEQKNWSVVRRVVGYDRYSSRPALEVLNRIYSIQRLYVNFFQPVMKLVSKTRNGARVHKVYDKAKTPYQRLLEAGTITEAKQTELAATYRGLNPVLLLQQLNGNLEHLWRLAERPGQRWGKTESRKVSVT